MGIIKSSVHKVLLTPDLAQEVLEFLSHIVPAMKGEDFEVIRRNCRFCYGEQWLVELDEAVIAELLVHDQ